MQHKNTNDEVNQQKIKHSPATMTARLFDLIKQGATVRQLQLVLESETDLECRNDRQETPLMAAMLNIHDPIKREKVMLLFIEYNANINCINMRGQTPLMYACILNLSREIRILLNEPQLLCNLQDFEGNTALMYASALGKTGAIETLVNANVAGQIKLDPYIMNVEGTSAFDYARETQDEIILKLLGRLVKEDTAYNYDTEQRVTQKTKKGKQRKGKHGKSKRIRQLAVDVKRETAVKHACNKDDISNEQKVVVWKEGADGQPTVAIGLDTACQSVEEVERAKTPDLKIPKKKSVIMNVHLPKTYDDNCDIDTQRTELIERASSVKPANVIYDDQVPSTSGLASSMTSAAKNKPRKRNGKRTRKKRSRIQTENSMAFDLGMIAPKPKGFGEEVVFCNKIYGADLYPCSGGPDDCYGDVDKLIAKIKSKVSGHMQPNFIDNWENKMKSKGTGKMDCMKMSAAERAKLLSRTIWSVYGAPLPPIPITVETVQRVMSGITRLRQYLGKAKYQPGRLLSLDPEMWCIIQSIKFETSTREQADHI